MALAADHFEHTRMTLGQHLAELRKRLIRAALALLVAVMVSWYYYDPLTKAVLAPGHKTLEQVDKAQREKYEKLYADELARDPAVKRTKYFRLEDPADNRLLPELTVSTRMVATTTGEQFAVAIRVSLWGALVLAAPFMLWEMWQFIAAGLYAREKRIILTFFPVSIVLFSGGVLFGYFLVCPVTFYFMVTVFAPEDIGQMVAIGPYVELFQGVSLALGAVFQLPLVMYALIRLDIVQRKTFAKYRGHFIVAAFLIGGILTPPDPVSQFMVAIPMIVLYEVGLAWAWFLPKPREHGAEDAP